MVSTLTSAIRAINHKVEVKVRDATWSDTRDGVTDLTDSFTRNSIKEVNRAVFSGIDEVWNSTIPVLEGT